jgi:putative thiamine transport system ATP-binding protein
LFQDDVLFPHLSVAQNLGFGLRPGGSRADRQGRVEAALDRMGLCGFGPRDPASLSGGQRARVSLARTLLAEPQARLLDEPFSRLDQTLRAQIRDLVFSETRNLPVILVTHDPEDARAAGGPVVSPL